MGTECCRTGLVLLSVEKQVSFLAPIVNSQTFKPSVSFNQSEPISLVSALVQPNYRLGETTPGRTKAIILEAIGATWVRAQLQSL